LEVTFKPRQLVKTVTVMEAYTQKGCWQTNKIDEEANRRRGLIGEFSQTRAEARVLKDILKNGEDEHVLQSRFLTKKDMRLILMPGEWLNDAGIEAYLRVVELNAKLNVQIANSWFFDQLCNSKGWCNPNAYSFQKVRRWSNPKRAIYLRPFKVDIFMVPIFQGKDHWSLAVAFMKEKCIVHFDSMSLGNTRLSRTEVTDADRQNGRRILEKAKVALLKVLQYFIDLSENQENLRKAKKIKEAKKREGGADQSSGAGSGVGTEKDSSSTKKKLGTESDKERLSVDGSEEDGIIDTERQIAVSDKDAVVEDEGTFDPTGWTIIPLPFVGPTWADMNQNDGSSCGLFVCMTADYIANGETPQGRKTDVVAWRKSIATAIIRHRELLA
jgi:hypothetical protein